MQRSKKNDFIDSRLWVLAYSKTNDFINAEKAGGISIDKVLGKTFGNIYKRNHFMTQYFRDEIGSGRKKHLLGTYN